MLALETANNISEGFATNASNLGSILSTTSDPVLASQVAGDLRFAGSLPLVGEAVPALATAAKFAPVIGFAVSRPTTSSFVGILSAWLS